MLGFLSGLCISPVAEDPYFAASLTAWKDWHLVLDVLWPLDLSQLLRYYLTAIISADIDETYSVSWNITCLLFQYNIYCLGSSVWFRYRCYIIIIGVYNLFTLYNKAI